LNVYKQQEEQKKQLDAAQIALANMNPFENPDQWKVFVQHTVAAAIKLGEISNELKKLERRLILCFFNNFIYSL